MLGSSVLLGTRLAPPRRALKAAGLTVTVVGCVLTLSGCGPAAVTRPADKAHLRLDELTPPATQPVTAPAEALTPEVGLLVLQAERRISRGDFEAAIVLLHRAATQTPDNARIAKDMGLALLGTGRRGKALEYFRRAERTAGDDVLLQMLLGQLEVSAGRTDEGLLALRRALKCSGASEDNPLRGEVLLALAELLAQNGYLAAADDCYAQLMDAIAVHGRDYMARPRLRPLVTHPARLLTRRGELLLRLERYEEARQMLQQAHARDRTDRRATELLLDAILAMKDFAAAEKLLLDIAAEPTAEAQLPELATKLCLAAKDPSLPMRLWRSGRSRAIDSGALAVALAQAARRLQADADAKEILDVALRTMPNDVAVGCFVAEEHARDGDALAAVRRLATLLTANDEAVEAVDQTLRDLAASDLLPEGLAEQVASEAATGTPPLKNALHYLAGVLAELDDRLAFAAEQYQAAVGRDGEFLPAYEAAVDLYLEAGRWDRAERLVEQLTALAEREPDVRYYALYLAGKNHLARGRFAEAAEAMEASRRDYDAFAPTLDLLAESYARLGQSAQAVEALDALTELEPDNADAARRLFDLCVAMGRVDHARAATVRLLAAEPDSLAGQAMLVELLLLTGKAEEGTRALEALQRRAADDAAVRLLTVRLAVGSTTRVMPREEFDEWTAEIGGVLLDQPDSLPARRLLAELLARCGRHAQAAAVLGELYAENPGLVDLAKGYVLELIQAEQSDIAQEVLETNPYLQRDLQARQWLLEILDKQDQPAAAAEYLHRWLDASEDRRFQDYCRLRLLDVYEKLGDLPAAQRQIDALLAGSPSSEIVVRLQAARVKLFCRQGEVDHAVALAETWTRADDAMVLKLALAGALSEGQAHAEAQRLLNAWMRRSKTESKALAEAKMLLFVRAGRLETAMEYARAWIDRSPTALAPRQIAVASLVDAENYSQALAWVDDWLADLEQLNPGAPGQPASQPTTAPVATWPSSLPASMPTTAPASMPATAPATAPAASQPLDEGLGALPPARPVLADDLAAARTWCRETAIHLLLMQGRYQDAVDRASAYQQAGLDTAAMWSLQSTALSELGRDAEALAALEKAHALASDDAGIGNNLGYFYAEMGVHLDKAEALIRQALARRGDEKDFVDSLGWVLYKQGRLGEAAAVFDRLLQGDKAVWPSCAISYDHAGDVFYRLGWTDRAAELWAKAVTHARKGAATGREVRRILNEAPGKIQAAQTGLAPAVAPLGQEAREEQD